MASRDTLPCNTTAGRSPSWTTLASTWRCGPVRGKHGPRPPHPPRYGLPQAMLMDNWGDRSAHAMGISVHHSRPYHPQNSASWASTARLKSELLTGRTFTDLANVPSTPGVTSTTWSAHTMPSTSTPRSADIHPKTFPTRHRLRPRRRAFCGVSGSLIADHWRSREAGRAQTHPNRRRMGRLLLRPTDKNPRPQ